MQLANLLCACSWLTNNCSWKSLKRQKQSYSHPRLKTYWSKNLQAGGSRRHLKSDIIFCFLDNFSVTIRNFYL